MHNNLDEHLSVCVISRSCFPLSLMTIKLRVICNDPD